MKLSWTLFALHLGAILFGLLGLLVMIPHPELWSSSATAVQFFPWAMNHGGPLHMVLGALAMIAFGVYAVGLRRTLIFAVVGTLLPLGAELMGTGTGWPFGGYAYTDFLGAKVGGRVPYSVPLSWFYMGFTSYLLALVITRGAGRLRSLWAVVLGAWLLMSWDLVLDPAMVTKAMPIQFWVWFEHGPYFGMPLRNLVGWFGTGVVFIAVSRLLWRDEPEARRLPVTLPLALYTANVVWAMLLSLSVGLWQPALLAIAFSLAPAALALRGRARSGPATPVSTEPLARQQPRTVPGR